MRTLLSISLALLFLASCATMKSNGKVIEGVYEVSCGMCNFDMTGDECALAIRIDGKDYYVEGSAIDEHGDAHAEDGLCTVIRKAKVKGTIKGGAFIAESVELIKE